MYKEKENAERDDLDKTIAYINREGEAGQNDLGKNPFEALHKRWRSGEDLRDDEREEMTDEMIEKWNEDKRDYLSRDY